MATEQNTPVDLEDFNIPDGDSGNDSGGNINLDPGDHVIGTVTAYKPWAGSNGLVEIDGRTLWLNRTMHQQLIEGAVLGATVAHTKSDEQESFTDNDGEEQTYYPRALGFPKSNE